MGWALDDDLKQIRRALADIVKFSDLQNAQVVHSVWWESLLSIPREQLNGKRIICHVPGEPFRYMTLPEHRCAIEIVGQWITQTTQAAWQFQSVGIKNILIPYVVDTNTFYPIPSGDQRVKELRTEWDIPGNRYLIGSFQRDTEGADLRSPKLMKGPDIFVEIVYGLWKKGYPIHVILAGPRRFWIRKRLDDLGIPFTFIGKITEEDDIRINVQPHSLLNILYNIIDVYIVSSRTEGGPRAILEAAAAKCKIISTNVGIAQDILQPYCIYNSVLNAIKLIEADFHDRVLADFLDAHYETIAIQHRDECVIQLFQNLYGSIESIPVYQEEIHRGPDPHKKVATSWNVSILKKLGIRTKSDRLTVGMWHKFVPPPWGGGNQFMLVLKKTFERMGIRIVVNRISPDIDAYLLQAIWFDIEKFRKEMIGRARRIIHRVDGPVHLIRGGDKELDDLCFDLNRELASATVIQSTWNLQNLVSSGYKPVNAVIIRNAVDEEIFNSQNRRSFSRKRKIKLISSSWSDNPRKGGPIYKWIDEHLDWNRFEYTFVGKASEHFQHICYVPPVSSEKLADILRQHDIYITASQNDPCSNALIEALACGLPALYLNDGGHPELVGYGGLPFNNTKEIIPQLDLLVENYEMFQRLIVVPSINDVAEKYISLLRGDY
jgi:glycosyltransferase involved in cell wall biosynthesis